MIKQTMTIDIKNALRGLLLIRKLRDIRYLKVKIKRLVFQLERMRLYEKMGYRKKIKLKQMEMDI